MSSAISPDTPRTRTTSWSDPRILLDAFAGQPGLARCMIIPRG
jgi:hypothetical protein